MYVCTFNLSMFSQSEENYLKAIYHLSEDTKKGVSTNDIANQLNTKASSVTDMVKKLSEKNLVSYKKYYGVTLTTKGNNIAINVIRKHRLWEVFLVEKLNFSWDEVHDVAEQLEHIKSQKLINRLDELLGFPTHDPHGDPIPDTQGNLKTIEKCLLSTLAVNEKGICVGVDDTSSNFLQFLDKKGITIGAEIEVIDKEDFDDSLMIQLSDEKLSISKKIANNIYIKKQ